MASVETLGEFKEQVDRPVLRPGPARKTSCQHLNRQNPEFQVGMDLTSGDSKPPYRIVAAARIWEAILTHANRR